MSGSKKVEKKKMKIKQRLWSFKSPGSQLDGAEPATLEGRAATAATHLCVSVLLGSEEQSSEYRPQCLEDLVLIAHPVSHKLPVSSSRNMSQLPTPRVGDR